MIDGVALTYEHRSPTGVFALISPWNMPLYLLTWKIAPCLAFGCTAVAKPSEVTSMSAFRMNPFNQIFPVPIDSNSFASARRRFPTSRAP
jgi:hypothetical protein